MAVYLKDPKTNFQLSCVRWIFHKIIFDDSDDELRKNEQPKAFVRPCSAWQLRRIC